MEIALGFSTLSKFTKAPQNYTQPRISKVVSSCVSVLLLKQTLRMSEAKIYLEETKC